MGRQPLLAAPYTNAERASVPPATVSASVTSLGKVQTARREGGEGLVGAVWWEVNEPGMRLEWREERRTRRDSGTKTRRDEKEERGVR